MHFESNDVLEAVPDALPFLDRRAAGAALAERLEAYRGTNAIVIGLPRGGVVVAAEVARLLEAPLDVIVARKLGSPISSELAIGAVTSAGERFLNEELIHELDVSEPYIEAVTHVQQAEAQRREKLFRGDRPPPRLAGRTVIIVDDGIATGATLRAAVRAARQQQPSKLVVAAPVGAPDACAELRTEADDVVCVYEPARLGAVGRWYHHFEQTEDDEVKRLLAARVPVAGASLVRCGT
jgi:putative phosphoribosyl transferase